MLVGFILKKSDKMVQGKRVFYFYIIVDSKFTRIPPNLKVPDLLILLLQKYFAYFLANIGEYLTSKYF